jgi:hypothetical protein
VTYKDRGLTAANGGETGRTVHVILHPPPHKAIPRPWEQGHTTCPDMRADSRGGRARGGFSLGGLSSGSLSIIGRGLEGGGGSGTGNRRVILSRVSSIHRESSKIRSRSMALMRCCGGRGQRPE